MKKRMNGEGNLKHRKDGLWEYSVMLGYRDDGKPNRVSVYGQTQTEAITKFRDRMIKADIDKPVSNLEETKKKPTIFSQWADIWMEGHRDNISASTYEDYRYTLKLLKEKFGDRDIASIKAMDIEDYLRETRAAGKSDSYLSKLRGMMYQIMNKAEANDLITKNPVQFAEKMRTIGPVNPKDSFTAEEVKKLFNKLPKNWIGLAIRLMLATGMRTQEVMALEPRHIEEDGSVIHIRQAIKEVDGSLIIGDPKSRDSVRDVVVPEFVRKYAVELRSTPMKYVCQLGPDPHPCTTKTFRKAFKEAIQAVGVRELTPHSCRHTYVSQMQALGVSMETIQSLAGHADMRMTEHYLHVQDPVKLDAASRFSKAFA